MLLFIATVVLTTILAGIVLALLLAGLMVFMSTVEAFIKRS